MSARSSFSDDAARARIEAAVGEAETRTNAEIVVALRRHASSYLGTSAALGAFCAAIALANLWFSPTVYRTSLIPLETFLVFCLGAFLSHSADPVRRALTPASVRSRALDASSAAAFRELGIARTKARHGVLVYVGLFEREVRVVADEGAGWDSLGEARDAVLRELERACRSLDLGAFESAVVSLGALLATTHPKTDDDENELCDAPV